LSLKRGDVVLVVASGDYGKPRPAVVVQFDLFNDTHASTTVCPVTSSLVAAPLFRVPLKPSKVNADRELTIALESSTTRNDRAIYAAKLDRIKSYRGQ
jgi:mRNA interferase MazF